MLLSRRSRDCILRIFYLWWLLAFVACDCIAQPLLPSLPYFFLCASAWAPLSLIKILVIGSRAHLCDPGCPYLKILNLITYAKTLSNKFIFTVPRKIQIFFWGEVTIQPTNICQVLILDAVTTFREKT